MLAVANTRAHKRMNIMAAGERKTVSTNDGVSGEIRAICALKMAKCMPLWTLSNAFTRAKPSGLAHARCTRVKVTFRFMCSLMRMFELKKCSTHKRNKII